MRSIRSALAAIALAGVAALAIGADGQGPIEGDVVRIEQLDLGEHWYGAPVTHDALVGKVVLVELWGSWVGCKAVTPHLVSLASRLEGAPFHLLATHRQKTPKEDVVAYIRSKGLAPDAPNMSVTSFGGHPQVKGNGYVPYYMVFDHTGKMVHHHMCGDYHGGDGLAMIEWVDRLLAETPDIWAGSEPFETHADLAKRITARKGFPGALTELEQALEADEDDELRRLHAAVIRWRDGQLSRADTLLASAPGRVLDHLEDIAAATKGTALGAPIAERLEALDGSPEVKRAIGVAKDLGKLDKRILKLEACKTCRRAGRQAMDSACSTCDEDNAKALRSLRKKLGELLEEAGELPISRAVQDRIAAVGE